MPRKIEISHRTIIFTVIFLLLLWLLYFLRGVLVILFFGLIFMAALNPLVDRWEKWKLPRALSIVLIYLLIFTATSCFCWVSDWWSDVFRNFRLWDIHYYGWMAR